MNPILFYLVDVADDIETVSIIALIFAIIAVIATVCTYLSLDDDWSDEAELKESAKAAMKSELIVILVAIGFIVVIPSKETIYEMLIAKYATAENADKLLEGIKSATEFIIEKAKEIK